MFRCKIRQSPGISPPLPSPPPPRVTATLCFFEGYTKKVYYSLSVCLFNASLYQKTVNLSLQPDPTKVESVQDVLARAAAKGLLGGITPEESKKGKKEKRRKDHEDPPDSQPSSPSSHDGETGNEFEDDGDPGSAGGRDEKRGEDESEKGKGGKKKRAKGRRLKVKRRPKPSAPGSRKHLKDNRLAAKKKQQPQSRRHLRKRRARKIPRLTLTLMSSAKPSSSLSTIAALAHKLSETVAIESQQTPEFGPRPQAPRPDSGPRPQAPLPAAIRRPNADAGRAEKMLKTTKAGTLRSSATTVGVEAGATTQVGSEVADSVLPPISRPPHSKRGGSVPRHGSRAFQI